MDLKASMLRLTGYWHMLHMHIRYKPVTLF